MCPYAPIDRDNMTATERAYFGIRSAPDNGDGTLYRHKVDGCGFERWIDDYQRNVPSWCPVCNRSATFTRVKE